MKKNFKYYSIICLVLFVLFNIIMFSSKKAMISIGIINDKSFWTVWAAISASFIINFICGYLAFRDDNLQKTAYNLSLISISWSSLVLTFVASCAFILIRPIPVLVLIIVLVAILAFEIISIIKAMWAINVVSDMDEKVKTKTYYIRELILDAQNLLAKAKDDEAKKAANKVYEALRYSDPMSNEGLYEIEYNIDLKMKDLKNAIDNEEIDEIKDISDEIILLINQRNNKCKLLK